MGAADLINLVIIIVVLYLAFRIGQIILKVLLGLVAIALVVYLLSNLLGGAGTP